MWRAWPCWSARRWSWPDIGTSIRTPSSISCGDTAEPFYDSETRETYRLIDVRAAIDSLQIQDDFGSSPAAAHDLGELTTTRLLAGAIGHSADVDYFTFVAGATGQATLTASGLSQPQWQLVDGASGQGTQFSFDVSAGQRYTFELGSGAGAGAYQLQLELGAATRSAPTWESSTTCGSTSQQIDGQATYGLDSGPRRVVDHRRGRRSQGGRNPLGIVRARPLGGAPPTAKAQPVSTLPQRRTSPISSASRAGQARVDLVAINLVRRSVGNRILVHDAGGEDSIRFLRRRRPAAAVDQRPGVPPGRPNRWMLAGGASDHLIDRGRVRSNAQRSTARGATIEADGWTLVTGAFFDHRVWRPNRAIAPNCMAVMAEIRSP